MNAKRVCLLLYASGVEKQLHFQGSHLFIFRTGVFRTDIPLSMPASTCKATS